MAPIAPENACGIRTDRFDDNPSCFCLPDLHVRPVATFMRLSLTRVYSCEICHLNSTVI